MKKGKELHVQIVPNPECLPAFAINTQRWGLEIAQYCNWSKQQLWQVGSIIIFRLNSPNSSLVRLQHPEFPGIFQSRTDNPFCNYKMWIYKDCSEEKRRWWQPSVEVAIGKQYRNAYEPPVFLHNQTYTNYSNTGQVFIKRLSVLTTA